MADQLLFRRLNDAGFSSHMDFDRRGTKGDEIAVYERANAAAEHRA